MAIARTRITSQGQISIPAEVRKKLGVIPGSVLEWEEDGDKFVVRRSGDFSWEDIRHTLFPDGPPRARTPEELKEALRQNIRERHARR